MRLARRDGLRNRLDVLRFRVDVERRRVLQQWDDLFCVGPRPARAPVAASAGVVLEIADRNAAVFIRVGTFRHISKTYLPQQDGRMPADVALPGVGGLSLAVKLNERAHQGGLL